MPISLQLHGLQPNRLLCPWNSPGKNTGTGCLSLLQRIFPTQGSNPGLPHYRQIFYHLSYREALFYLNGKELYTKFLWRGNKIMGFPGGSADKESTCNAGDLGLIPGLERSSGEGNGYPPQYSGLYSPWGHKESATTEQLSLHFTKITAPSSLEVLGFVLFEDITPQSLSAFCIMPQLKFLFWKCQKKLLISHMQISKVYLIKQLPWWLRSKDLPTNSGDKGSILVQEDPLEKELGTHSRTLAWEISWTEEPGGLQSMGSRKGSDMT